MNQADRNNNIYILTFFYYWDIKTKHCMSYTANLKKTKTKCKNNNKQKERVAVSNLNNY